MVYVDMVGKPDDGIEFEYRPECRSSNPGSFVISNDGALRILKYATNGNADSWYLSHAVPAAIEMMGSGEPHKVVSWY
jgi:hypothetical protein